MIKTERNEFERDAYSMALINTDKKSFQSYKEQKARNERINSLEKEVKEMKSLLKKVLDRVETNGN